MEKKQRIDVLMQATSSIKNAIYWLEKTDKKIEVASLYQMMSEISSEVSTLANELKNEMFNH